jgi:N6-adenosine-specific RNA methylase IME4
MKFGAILIDPPWGYDTYSKKGQVPARGKQPYATMTLDQIAELPIADLLDKNGCVFLWESNSLPCAAEFLCRKWGLRYVVGNIFIWRKLTKDGSRTRIGMGKWTRYESESVALFTRGKPKRLSCGVRQIIDAPRREHSRKPDEIYDRIEALVGGPYLEMFARQRRKGWSALGDEIEKFAEVTI